MLESSPIKLDIGCGPNKVGCDWLGIDSIAYDGVDMVGDVFEVLAEIESESVDKIHTSHFLEHIDDLSRFLSECERVLKVGGDLEIIVPHFSNPYYYSDPTHRIFFGLYSMSYFVGGKLFAREVPSYSYDFFLQLLSVKLIFKDVKPFYLSYLIRRVFGYLINFSVFSMEFYERWLSKLFWCYEIRYSLKKKA